MEGNPIQNWISTDENLQDLIIEIESTEKSLDEQAELAFEKLSKLYSISRMPNDIADDESEDNEKRDGAVDRRSLFEEHALLKYLSEEDDDPRGIVLLAAFQLLNNYRVDYVDVANKEFKNRIPENCQIGIIGEGYYGKVVFPQKETKNWIDLGCIVMTRLD
jgi:hypothetical protein